MQPIIDIITALSIEYLKLTITFGIVVRTIFMLTCVVLSVIKAKKKYKIVLCTYYGILFTYMLFFLINCYFKNGTELIFMQIKGLVKNFYFPIMLCALIPIFNEYNIDVNKKVLSTTLMIYVITIFICNIFGIAFPTYKGRDKAGTVGLFYSANEIGAILCLLSPFLIADLAKRKLKITDWICLLLFIYAVLQLGTKVPYFGLIILLVSIVFACIINAKVKKEKYSYKKAGMFVAITICIYITTGLTPVGQNLAKIYGDIFPITKEMFQNKESSRYSTI